MTHRGRGRTYQTETDTASECHVLSIVADLRVREEKRHGDEGANDLSTISLTLISSSLTSGKIYHCPSPTPEEPAFAHVAGQDRARDGAEIGYCVISPLNRGGRLTERGSASRQVRREEHVVQRVSETDQKPGEPDEQGRESEPRSRKKAFEMNSDLVEGEPLLRMFFTGPGLSARLHELQG